MATPNVLRNAKMQVYKQKAEMEVYKVKLRALVRLSQAVILEGWVCKSYQVWAKVILILQESTSFF